MKIFNNNKSMLNMDCLIKTIEMEEIYKYICEISIKLSIKKEILLNCGVKNKKFMNLYLMNI